MPRKDSQKQETYSLFDENKKFKEGFAEVNSGEVMTIQNEAYTIKQLLEKFTTGVLRPGDLQNAGMEEVDYQPDMLNMTVPEIIDRTDISEYVTEVNARKKLVDNALAKKAAEIQKIKAESPGSSEAEPGTKS